MPGKKKKTEDLEEINESQEYANNALAEQLGGGNDALLKALLESSDKKEELFVPDARVELSRDLAELGLAHGKYKKLLPQLTTLDDPHQVSSLASDMTQLEWLRACGLPEVTYNMLKGQEENSGFGLYMRLRVALFYPGSMGAIMHPRPNIFDSLKSQMDLLKDKITGHNRN